MKNKRLSLILFLSAVILSVAVIGSLAAFADEADVVKGDVTGDGIVDSADVILLSQYFASYDYDSNTSTLEHPISDGADFDGNGTITLADLQALRLSLVDRPCEHEWIDANCLAPKTCSKCGETEGEIGEHTWNEGAVTTDPTCEGKGVKTYTCAHDATHTYTEEIDAIGHEWDEGVVTTDPTCTTDGVKTYTCANDASHTKTEAVPAAHSWVDATVDAPKTCSACGATEGGCIEIQQDNVFTAEDILAAYKANPPANFKGELVTEGGVTYFKATATAAAQGTLVLNSGANTVSNVGKNFVVVYRNKTQALKRIQLGVNSAGKTNNAGGAAPFQAISITNNWTTVYLNTSTAVDLTNGAGYMSVDFFDTDNGGVVHVGDVMEIALIAFVDSKDTAQNVVGEYCGSYISFPYAVNIAGVVANGKTINDKTTFPTQSATSKAIDMDLSTITLGGSASNCLKLGAGWAITRGGWDYYECKITDSDGATKTIRIDEGNNNISSSTLAALTAFDYGENKGLGGSLFTPVTINLTGFEDKTVTIEVYGISNFGMKYKLANMTNVSVPKLDNFFTAEELYTAHKLNPNDKFTSELLTDENGITYFRATATQDGVGNLVLNDGTNAVPGVGKHFILVYRNNTNNVKRFDLYLNSAGKKDNTGGINPFIQTSKTDKWTVLVFKTGQNVNLANGAGYISIDLFNKNGIVGDTFDIALFALVESEEAAWQAYTDYFAGKVALPYMLSASGGFVVNGTTYKGTTTSAVNAPIVVDLEGKTASGDLKTAVKLSPAGWVITREGMSYYICKITSESGKTKTIRIANSANFPEISGTRDNLLSNASYTNAYGENMCVGGNLYINPSIDLTGFEGEKVTLEVIGVSNLGSYCAIMTATNLQVAG